MIYAIPVLFRKHTKKFTAQNQFSNANPIIALRRKVREVGSEKSVDVMNAKKAKSKMMLTIITVTIATTIYV